jgi:import receptor subunit TOM70
LEEKKIKMFPVGKWQIALMIGTTIGIGITYLYWRKQTVEVPADDNEKKKKKGVFENKISIDEVPTENGKAEVKVEMTPLEKSLKFKVEGNQMFKNGKYDEAIKCYDSAIDTCPRSKESTTELSQFYQNRAAAYEQLKKWENVKKDCSSALELNPKYLKALHRRAKAFEHTNELELCLEDVTATCILEGFQNNATLILADRILKDLGKKNAKDAMANKKPIEPSKTFIKNYFKSFFTDPIKQFKSDISLDGEKQQSGFIKALSLLQEQKYVEAVAACTEEIDNIDTNVESNNKIEAMLLRGTLLLIFGDFQEALKDFDAIMNNESIDVSVRSNALIKRASLKMQMEKFEECMNDFDTACQIDPKNPDVYFHRGQVFLLQDQLDRAIDDFDKASNLLPEHGLTHIHALYAKYRKAAANQDSRELFKIIESFTDALKKYPDVVECYSLLAQVLSDQQQFQLADEYFEKAIKLDANNAQIHVHRGLLQLQWMGNIDKAMEYFEKAIAIDEKCEFAYETLGTVEVQRGNLEHAIELFEKALTLAKSELEMVHLFSLKNAAVAQYNVTKKMGIDISALASTIGNGIPM